MNDTPLAQSVAPPPADSGRNQAAYYLQMLTIRLFEEEVRTLRLAGDIVGSVHLCLGQEAIPVGIASALELSRDTINATYRGHGWAIAAGVPLRALFAELLGRATGTNGGRGGSAYLSAPDYGFLGENSIVGGGSPIACGAALAARYDGSGRVAVTVFGDGAMNQGATLESLNFAAAYKLPMVFVCENNLWSELTPISMTVADPILANRAAAFGLRSVRIDGNNPHQVREEALVAVDHARSGQGPVFIEAMTERIAGHYIGDPETYRNDDDRQRLADNDPLPRERARLETRGMAPLDLTALARDIESYVLAARQTALSDPLASPTNAMSHVFG